MEVLFTELADLAKQLLGTRYGIGCPYGARLASARPEQLLAPVSERVGRDAEFACYLCERSRAGSTEFYSVALELVIVVLVCSRHGIVQPTGCAIRLHCFGGGSKNAIREAAENDVIHRLLVFEIAQEASKSFWGNINNRVTWILSIVSILGLSTSTYLFYYGISGKVEKRVDEAIADEVSEKVLDEIKSQGLVIDKIVQQVTDSAASSFLLATETANNAKAKANEAGEFADNIQMSLKSVASQAQGALAEMQSTRENIGKQFAEQQELLARSSKSLREFDNNVNNISSPDIQSKAKVLLDYIAQTNGSESLDALLGGNLQEGLMAEILTLKQSMLPPIGTIVASVMPWDAMPDTFKEFWVPADGRPYEAVETSQFAQQIKSADPNVVRKMIKDGSVVVPDLTGVFLRGLNRFAPDFTKENSKLRDPEGENRTPGDFQEDQFLNHEHVYWRTFGKAGEGRTEIDKFRGASSGGGNNSIREGANLTTSNAGSPGGLETRPKNVAVYFYIRVN